MRSSTALKLPTPCCGPRSSRRLATCAHAVSTSSSTAERSPDRLSDEAGHYLRVLADLWAVSSLHEARLDGPLAVWMVDGRVPTLPQQLLAQRLVNSVGNIFGLLELVENPEDVRAAQRSLLSGQTKLRSRALEYLDNTLSGSLRRDLFAVIDDAPPEEKLRRAQAIFGVHFESPEETLKRMIQIDPVNDPSAIGIVLAALYNVWDEEIVALYPMVKTLAEEAEEPMVKETAAWVCHKVEAGPRTRGVLARGGESDMGPMAQIEMMVFLQGVDLFAHCNADQVLRLAAIASEHAYEKGEVIFRRDGTSRQPLLRGRGQGASGRRRRDGRGRRSERTFRRPRHSQRSGEAWRCGGGE